MSFSEQEVDEDEFGQSYEDPSKFEYNGEEFDGEDINPQSPLDESSKPRIILMGLRRSGKSSIAKVVFEKMSPNETLFLESTNKIVKQEVDNSSFVQFQIWDFPGQIDLFDGTVDYSQVFGGCGALIFVIDAQDDYMEALNKLNTTVVKAYKINANIKFIVFIHKVDGLNEDTKMETQRDIHQRATDDLRDACLDASCGSAEGLGSAKSVARSEDRSMLMALAIFEVGSIPGLDKIHLSFHLTSIYDHSIFEAFSKVVQKLIIQLATLENLLDLLISRSGIEKAFLFDVISKIYVATDCSPVDMQSYELCCDMIDVVIDIAGIYGSEGNENGPFDSSTSSIIKLNNGTVLYMREVNKFLALVCILREDNFEKQGVIDYNFLCFRNAIRQVFELVSEESESATNGPTLTEEEQLATSP